MNINKIRKFNGSVKYWLNLNYKWEILYLRITSSLQ